MSVPAAWPASHQYVRLPLIVWAGAAALSVLAITAPHPATTIAAIALLPVLVKLSWRIHEPPIIPFILAYQWLQASVLLLVSAATGDDISDLAVISGSRMLEATVLSLLGVLALLAGIRAAWRLRSQYSTDCSLSVGALRPQRAFVLYLLCMGFGLGAGTLRGAFPEAWQIVMNVSQARYVFLFLLCVHAIRHGRDLGWMFAALVCDFAVGTLSYFSEFKTGLFVALLALGMTDVRGLTRRQRLGLAAGIGALVLIAGVWASVKTEYRYFLNQGSGLQVSEVTNERQVARLAALIREVTLDDIPAGLRETLERVGYVEFFGHVLNDVPASRAHEGGTVWLGAVENVLAPRILFPGKANLVSDTEVSQRYTGLYLGAGGGTSISLGYMADSYIDFGPLGMFVPIFCIGFLMGLIHHWVLHHRSPMAAAFAVAILMQGALLETSSVKMLGGLLSATIVLGGALMLVGKPLQQWLGYARKPLG